MASLESADASQRDEGERLSSLRSVTDGASLHLLSKLAGNGATFVLSLLLTNALGADLYGIYSYGRRILGAVVTFTPLGTNVTLTRFLSANRGDLEAQNRTLALAYLTTFGASLLAGAGIFLYAGRINAATLGTEPFTVVLQIFGAAIPFVSMVHLAANSFRGLEMPAHQNLINVSTPVSRLLVVSAAIAVGYSVVGITAAFVAASVVAFAVAAVALRSYTDLLPSLDFTRGEAREFYDYSLPLSASRAGTLLYNRMDVFMVGIFLGARDVGIYSIAMLLAGVITLPLSGFNQLFPPVASRLYADEDTASLVAVYATVTRWSITITLILALPLLVYGSEVLRLFGPEFTAGVSVLSLFVLGQLVNAFSGPSNDVLSMTDNQYVVMVNHWGFGLLNVVLNYYFIVTFGITGAALATATILAVLNVTRVLEVWYFERLFAYTTRLWKPVVSVGGAAAVMYAVAAVLSGLPLVIAGSALGALVYGLLLYALGFEERDKALARDYLSIAN